MARLAPLLLEVALLAIQHLSAFKVNYIEFLGLAFQTKKLVLRRGNLDLLFLLEFKDSLGLLFVCVLVRGQRNGSVGGVDELRAQVFGIKLLHELLLHFLLLVEVLDGLIHWLLSHLFVLLLGLVEDLGLLGDPIHSHFRGNELLEIHWKLVFGLFFLLLFESNFANDADVFRRNFDVIFLDQLQLLSVSKAFQMGEKCFLFPVQKPLEKIRGLFFLFSELYFVFEQLLNQDVFESPSVVRNQLLLGQGLLNLSVLHIVEELRGKVFQDLLGDRLEALGCFLSLVFEQVDVKAVKEIALGQGLPKLFLEKRIFHLFGVFLNEFGLSLLQGFGDFTNDEGDREVLALLQDFLELLLVPRKGLGENYQHDVVFIARVLLQVSRILPGQGGDLVVETRTLQSEDLISNDLGFDSKFDVLKRGEKRVVKVL